MGKTTRRKAVTLIKLNVPVIPQKLIGYLVYIYFDMFTVRKLQHIFTKLSTI